MFLGFLLVILGAIFLLRNMGVLPFWYGWSELWPVLLIALGLAMVGDSIFKKSKKKDKTE
jgi:uncharacterized integral membrane protein